MNPTLNESAQHCAHRFDIEWRIGPCSVMFHDPVKFSIDRDEKARRELAENNRTSG